MKNYTIQITFEVKAKSDNHADFLAERIIDVVSCQVEDRNLYEALEGFTIDEVWPCAEEEEE